MRGIQGARDVSCRVALGVAQQLVVCLPRVFMYLEALASRYTVVCSL